MSPHEQHRKSSSGINDHGGDVIVDGGGDNNIMNNTNNAIIAMNGGVVTPSHHDESNPPQRQLHVKDEEWDNLGRSFLHCSNNNSTNNGDEQQCHTASSLSSSHEESIERNSAMLEDLLLLAIQHDHACYANNNTNDDAADDSAEEKIIMPQPQLPSELKTQLRSYVTQISSKYHHVGFHSFEHASHVMLSATKLCYLLKDAAADAAAAAHASNNNEEEEEEVLEDDKMDKMSSNGSSVVDNNTVGSCLYDDPSTPKINNNPTTTTTITNNSIYDPWLHFALTFAALLHDVDHKGLPNTILKSHSDPLSIRYGAPMCMSSYAEWNSVDIGLSLLECEEFDLLRGVLLHKGSGGSASGGGGGGGENFMKMVQDLVLCTDIASSQRRELGMSKWDRLFVVVPTTTTSYNSKGSSGSWSGSGGGTSWRNHRRSSVDTLEVSNTKSAKAKIANANNTSENGVGGDKNDDKDGADQQDDGSTTPLATTIQNKKIQLQTLEAARAIAEQIMQAADVSHTMQHFDTFLKWNQSLYHEILAAHYQAQKENVEGEGSEEHDRNERHPAQNWYESQIGFFDGYVIPLAKRLDACGAFGTGGGGEGGGFVPLAVRNKELWILRGRECTRTMVSEAEGVQLPPPMPLNLVEGGESDVGAGGKENAEQKHRPMPKSTFLQRRIILGKNSVDEESSDADDLQDDLRLRVSAAANAGGNDTANDNADVLSVPGSVETSGRISIISMASSRASTSSRNLKWGPQSKSGGEEIDSSVNALVPNMLVRQMIDTLENDCDLAPHQQMSALREAVSKYQSNGSIRRHRGALLFVDVSGFTNLAQNYPVEDFKTFINRYFTKIINLIKSFGGEVVKFAGDALYAIWTCPTIEKSGAALESHAINIEKCTACAIAISSECNSYKISKSYNRRASSMQSDVSSVSNRVQGEVLYNFQDKNAKYEKRGAVLNVYCGVSEGIMAGVDVVSSNRAEFFLIGKPLKGRWQKDFITSFVVLCCILLTPFLCKPQMSRCCTG